MKKLNCFTLCSIAFCLCGLLINSIYCADKKPVGTKKTTEKQTINEKDTGDIDEIQKQYLENLSGINKELKTVALGQLLNVQLTKLQNDRELLELQYRGRIPEDVNRKRR